MHNKDLIIYNIDLSINIINKYIIKYKCKLYNNKHIKINLRLI